MKQYIFLIFFYTIFHKTLFFLLPDAASSFSIRLAMRCSSSESPDMFPPPLDLTAWAISPFSSEQPRRNIFCPVAALPGLS